MSTALSTNLFLSLTPLFEGTPRSSLPNFFSSSGRPLWAEGKRVDVGIRPRHRTTGRPRRQDIHGCGAPQFPSIDQWIANNQLPDGSWGDSKIFSAHDGLISTIACVVALKSWNMHGEYCEKGLSFFKENISKLEKENAVHMPIGFEVAFLSILEIARSLGIEVPDQSPLLLEIYAKRSIKLARGILMTAVVDAKPVSTVDTLLPVFVKGRYTPTCTTVEPSKSNDSPPKQLFVVSPEEEGTYDVILFLHGTSLSNKSYSQLFQHIVSHGYIVVAPQLYNYLPPSGNNEVDYAAQVTNWLFSGLQSILPETVKPNLNLLALSGHSRGGQTAFSLALGYAKNPQVVPQFSALIGIDPVAGTNKSTELDPSLLSYDSFSFLSSSMPVTVIGTGLGGVVKCMLPCAPENGNHVQFFKRCKLSTRAHFDSTEYGHMDVLDDRPPDISSRFMSSCMCTNGKNSRDPMRRCVGGIAVGFLMDTFQGKSDQFLKIVQDPSIAPVKLDSVEFIQE